MADDTQSVAEARDLVARAHAAWKEYRLFSQAKVDAIVDAMAAVATAHAEPLARLAVEETTYGKVADKITKNLFASEKVYGAIRKMPTVGLLSHDRDAGIIELGEGVGVVAAILPCTNPTSTAIYKMLISLKAGCGIVVSPHPAAMRCICEAVGLMRRAAIAQGAPADLIGCFSTPTMAGTQALMQHPKTRVVLATGGMGIVRAAYSSGKPAFGVGPGNVPAYIDRSAQVERAVANVVFGKSFDWGTICSSEQALVAETALRTPILAELERQQVYLMSPEEADKLGRVLINLEHFTVNAKCVGQAPRKLATMAGFGDKVSDATRVLAAELVGMGKEYPLSAEKLSPVLALYFMPDRESCIQRCSDLLHFGGLGHTCVIHAEDDEVVREYGRRMSAFRVVVNTNSPQGSIGATTNLFPAMTLGCGAVGGNITSDNIGPQHLINRKRIAWPAKAQPAATKPAGGGYGVTAPAAARPAPPAAPVAAAPTCACQHGGAARTSDSDLQGMIEQILAERGIRPQRAPATAAAPAAPAPAPAAAPVFAAPQPPPKPKPVAFVCEADVRDAIANGRKIAIGPKTIVTPSASDLGRERNVFESA